VHPQDRFWRIVLPRARLPSCRPCWPLDTPPSLTDSREGYSPTQPIAFSHRLHAGDNHVPCLYCHTGAERSRHAGVPAVETCMNCHAVTRTDKPEVQRVIAAFKANQPIQWQRIYTLPDHVYFDHGPTSGRRSPARAATGSANHGASLARNAHAHGELLACHRDAHEVVPAGSKITSGPTNCFACHR